MIFFIYFLVLTSAILAQDFSNCLIWFDGCNYCKVYNGKYPKCHNMECSLKQEPFCRLQKSIKNDETICSKSLI